MKYAFQIMLVSTFLVLSGCLNSIQTIKEQDKMRETVKDINALSDYDLCYLALNPYSLNVGDMMWSSNEESKNYVKSAKARGLTCGVFTEKGHKINTRNVSSWSNNELCNFINLHFKRKHRNAKFKYSIIEVMLPETKKRNLSCISQFVSKSKVNKSINIAVSESISFKKLNPSEKNVKLNKNAIALIVGIGNYENTNADAIYADKDALIFSNYAKNKLGVSKNKIKLLLNDVADYGEILLATKDWIRRVSKANKSEIYIFFAGHGLASQDGKNMYLLPYDGRPRLLDDTALMRDRLFKEIQLANPRSVTVFLDTCYSGTTRGTDMLIASRPIAIPAQEQSIPENFTVFSAAAGDQTSKPLEEAKHGMFSYFLMKGMEGDADTNNDNKITARELHAYVEQNVVQQSSGSQTPELQGDADRVLVRFN